MYNTEFLYARDTRESYTREGALYACIEGILIREYRKESR